MHATPPLGRHTTWTVAAAAVSCPHQFQTAVQLISPRQSRQPNVLSQITQAMWCLPASTTSAPLAAAPRAMAAPMPWAPPVMKATEPLRSKSCQRQGHAGGGHIDIGYSLKSSELRYLGGLRDNESQEATGHTSLPPAATRPAAVHSAANLAQRPLLVLQLCRHRGWQHWKVAAKTALVARQHRPPLPQTPPPTSTTRRARLRPLILAQPARFLSAECSYEMPDIPAFGARGVGPQPQTSGGAQCPEGGPPREPTDHDGCRLINVFRK